MMMITVIITAVMMIWISGGLEKLLESNMVSAMESVLL